VWNIVTVACDARGIAMFHRFQYDGTWPVLHSKWPLIEALKNRPIESAALNASTVVLSMSQ
jgi:hypothetical protein